MVKNLENIYFMLGYVPIKQKSKTPVQFVADIYLTLEVSTVCVRTG